MTSNYYFEIPCGFKGPILPEVIYWQTLYSSKTKICLQNMLEALAYAKKKLELTGYLALFFLTENISFGMLIKHSQHG